LLNIKYLLAGGFVISCILWIYLIVEFHYSSVSEMGLNRFKSGIDGLSINFCIYNIYFNINELSLIFISLVCFLFLPVIIIMDLEFSVRYYKYIIYMV